MTLTNAQLALRSDYLTGPQGLCFGTARTLDNIEVRIINLSFHRTYEFSGIIKGSITDEIDQFTLGEIEKFAQMSKSGKLTTHMILPPKIGGRLPLFFTLIDLEALATQEGDLFSCLRVVKFEEEFDFTKSLELVISNLINEISWKELAENFSP